MVRRSLVIKSLLYAAAVVCLSVPAAIWVGRSLMDLGRHDAMHKYLATQFEAAGREVERTMGPNGPDKAQLEDVGLMLHHKVRFVPWGDMRAYPAALRAQKLLFDERPIEQLPDHWLRLDRNGAPVGALELSLDPGGRPPPPPLPSLAWGWVVLLLLIIVPPLWLWVIRPLQAMTVVTRRLGSGDLDTPIVRTRHDEFGDLEAAFEQMRVELRGVMEQKERLLTDVSHEIRGPLARMTLALPLIAQQGTDSPYLELLAREVRTIDDLLERVLQLARGRRPMQQAKEPIDIGKLADELVAARELVAEQQGRVLKATCESAVIEGAPRAIQIALGNLIDNAIKYTLDGGRIEVTTRVEGNQAVFRVKDNGPGIGATHLPHIFEPFYRPDTSRSRETGGTGLGLAIVRTIAEGHGGSVSLDSAVGVGTTAEVRLPLSRGRRGTTSLLPGL